MPHPKRIPVVAALTLLATIACGGSGGNADPLVPNPDAIAATQDSAFVASVRAQLTATTQAGLFSGAVLVTRDGRTVMEEAYGLADRERNIPNTPQTQFRVGSM